MIPLTSVASRSDRTLSLQGMEDPDRFCEPLAIQPNCKGTYLRIQAILFYLILRQKA